MAIAVAYIAVIIVWSTTPLALKWSTEDVGFLFAAVSRMALGFVCVMVLATVRGEHLRFRRRDVKVYAASAIGIYGAMLAVYWGAQFIASGWVALVFGLSPLFTTVLAAIMLGERSFGVHKLLAQIFGLGGLAIIFYSGLAIGTQAALGIGAIVLSTTLHAFSAVLVKRINSDLPVVSVVAGGLLFALGPYTLTWWLFDGQLPTLIPPRALAAIIYLGVVATSVGFTLYYFILKRQTPTQVALITFVSPITALALGHILNDEPFEARVLAGAGLVLIALFLHELVPALRSRLRRRADVNARAAPLEHVA